MIRKKLLFQYLKKIVRSYDLVLISDYGKGIFTDSLTSELIDIAKENFKKIFS